eukprot:TRINITY_DN1832_c0_g1_i3.p1 TRINITY_DN1832_c0_g1~~TRINITY_DN1832_c0_g1_i3.p1  ORF type:complete len:1034 (+),score=302.97 TRINITY_DN1832_c0_g1_i3:77-3178(+)
MAPSVHGATLTAMACAIGLLIQTAGFSSAFTAGGGRVAFLDRRDYAGAETRFSSGPEHNGHMEAAACLGTGLSLGALLALAATRVRGGVTTPAKPFAGATVTGLQEKRGCQPTAASVTCRAMFERFTANAMKAVMLAQAEARTLGHENVGTEMLVVGILAEGNDEGCKALTDAGVKLQDARDKLAALVGEGPGSNTIEIPFSQGAKEVLEDTIEVARQRDCATVNSGHLLRALVAKVRGDGTTLLLQLTSCEKIEDMREKVLAKLDGEDAKAAPTATSAPASDQSQSVVPPAETELKLTETLKYAEDLTKSAEDGKLDPLVGREAQLERTIRILGRRSKNNPVYVGEAGVGKTSIANGLAQRIVQGRVPPTLQNKRVLSLDLALLLAGTRYRGDFEERLRAVIQEVVDSDRRVILVVDEVHTLVGAGSSTESGGMDAANLLKPALARGQLQCLGATTLDEYRQYIEKDPALERRFQPVFVPEPTEEEAEQILAGLAPRYEKHHQLRYTPEAIRAAVKLASQYISDRFLPDKAIDVMDEAGAKVRQQLYQESEELEELAERRALAEELEEVKQQKAAAVLKEEFEDAQRLKVSEIEIESRIAALDEKASNNCKSGTRTLLSEAELNEQLKVLRARLQEAAAAECFEEASQLKAKEREVLGASLATTREAWVTEEDMAQVVASWTGVAVEQVSATESARLLRLEEQLSKSVVGQQEAVSSVSRALRRARAGLRSQTRPIAAFMFSGPTGVGKTELCKTLASSFFGSADSMIRLDMSEFMEKHTVSKLIGAPPGYVGYGEGGTLTEAVRRRPYSLVLFDEVEKAHPDVFNMLLQLLDDGRLTDSKGRLVSFSNTLIVMTSNIGSRSVQKGAGGGMGLGFGTESDTDERNYNVISELVHEEMKTFFRPEFLNRLDEICVFRPLTKDDIRAIAENEFSKVTKRLVEAGMDVSLTGRFKEHVVEAGFDPAYGARPLRRAITRLLEDSLAEFLLDTCAQQEGEDDTDGEEVKSRALIDVMDDGRVKVITLPRRSDQLTAA